MAQTVALQRGSTTVTSDGTSTVTLFTQSGGTATRVIVNNLAITFSSSINTGQVMSIVFYLTQTGSQTVMLGLIRRTSNGNRSFQFTPGVSTNSPFGNASSIYNAAQPTTYLPTNPIIHGSGTNGTASGAASTLSVTYCDTSSNGQTIVTLLNSNFYMGPSDLVGMKIYAATTSGKSYVFTTATISYSFTTITES